MKNELSKEDHERIEKAAIDYGTAYPGAFEAGAKYEHPIAKKEGFNEALDEAMNSLTELSKREEGDDGDFIWTSIKEIEKLKND
jgi:hypothetical protein